MAGKPPPPIPVSVNPAPGAAPIDRVPKRVLRWLAVGLALVGWWLSFDLLRITTGNAATNPLLAAQCGPSRDTPSFLPSIAPGGALDCLSVLNSRFARVRTEDAEGRERLGLPWAAVGMGYFAFVGLWYWLIGAPTRGRGWRHLPIAIVVGFGAFVSIDLTNVMANELRRWCIGCVAAHVVNAMLAIITLLAFPWTRRSANWQAFPSGRLVAAGGLAAAAVFILHIAATQLMVLNTGLRDTQDRLLAIVDDPEYIRWRHARQPLVEIPARDDEPFVGDPAAPNTIVAFIDFQCEACRDVHERLNKLVAAHPGLVRVAYRHYPQDAACNVDPAFRAGGHPAACAAAYAVEAVRVVGGRERVEPMRALLYTGQAELDRQPFVDWARGLGLDAARFDAARQDAAVQARVQADIALGRQLGVSSVPTLFLNGRRVSNFRKLSGWEALLGLTPATQPASAPG